MKEYLTTYTKVPFNTFDPDEDKIDIKDIAHALSMMTRANGHYPEFFSVGQHSVQCCKEAMKRNYVPEIALACLLHDASEAYLADITRPVKKNMTMYLQIEEQLQNLIYSKYLDFIPRGEQEILIQKIDDACLYYEFKYYMDEELFPVAPVLMSDFTYEFQPMKEVEAEFLKLFETLNRRIRGNS